MKEFAVDKRIVLGTLRLLLHVFTPNRYLLLPHLPLLTKELAEEFGAGIGVDTVADFTAVVESRVVE